MLGAALPLHYSQWKISLMCFGCYLSQAWKEKKMWRIKRKGYTFWTKTDDKVTLNRNLITFLIHFRWQKLPASTLSTFWKKRFYRQGQNAVKKTDELLFLPYRLNLFEHAAVFVLCLDWAFTLKVLYPSRKSCLYWKPKNACFSCMVNRCINVKCFSSSERMLCFYFKEVAL